ncbi:MAG: NAD(P)-dependent oxidoreductase [Burkholderiaceae bacterium]|nr:NAD(P)-dependent oxidoreductase [Burkholderiaceae bacterium]
MIDQTVLVTGAGGMLGNAIVPYFRTRYRRVLATDKILSEPWLQALDVRDEAALRAIFERERPALVLHLAAETDLEFCEQHPDVAEAVNHVAAGRVAELTQAGGATLVYISTAGVFDGTKPGFYTESDAANPIMVYGRTKLDGELAVARACQRQYTVRAGWMVGGGSRKDHKFVMLMLQQLLAGQTTLHAVDDRWGTPTYTHDFAMNLFRLLDTGAYGLYHMVCEGFGSRFDVAAEILKVCRREDVELVPVGSEFFKDRYFAPRPPSEMMRNQRLGELGINLMRPWQAALRDYLSREFPQALRDGLAGGWDGADRRRDADGIGRGRRISSLGYGGPERRSGLDRRQLQALSLGLRA